MAITTITKMADVIIPEVLANEIDKKLVDAIRFTPLAYVDTTLEGRAGDKVKLPSFNYIGDATQVSEATDIPITKLTQTSDTVEIKKFGRGVAMSDESQLAAQSDLAAQAVKQIVTSIASGVENEFLTSMANVPLKHIYDTSKDAAYNVAASLQYFGEDADGEKVLVVPPEYYLELVNSKGWVPNTEIGANIIVSGTVGSVYGTQVVMSNRLKGEKAAYVVKPGALALFSKRNTLVEFDRDIVKQVDVIVGSKLFAPYVYDKSKIVKMDLTALMPTTSAPSTDPEGK